jgi:hypothetical protein
MKKAAARLGCEVRHPAQGPAVKQMGAHPEPFQQGRKTVNGSSVV